MHEQHEIGAEVKGDKTTWDNLGEEVPFDSEEARRLADLEKQKSESNAAAEVVKNAGEAEVFSADTEESGEQEERHRFAGAMLTEEELGLDKIIIPKIEPSHKKGLFAKLEERRLNKIIDKINDIDPGDKSGDGGMEELDVILGQLSPTEAYGLSEKLDEFRADLALHIIEALPIAEQERLFSEGGSSYLIEEAYRDGYGAIVSGSIVAKYLAGQKEASDRVDASSFDASSFNKVNMLLIAMGSGQKIGRGLSEQIMQSSLTEQEGVNKVLLTLLCKPDDELAVNEALEIAGKDKTSLMDVFAMKLSGIEASEKNKEELSGLMALLKFCGEKFSYNSDYRLIHVREKEAEGIDGMIHDEKDWLSGKIFHETVGLLCDMDKREQTAEMLEEYEGMSDGQRKRARDYVMRQDLFGFYDGDIKDVPSKQEILASFGYEALEKLRTKEARRFACEAVLGVRFSDVCRDLTAFGLLDFSNYDVRQMNATGDVDEYYESALYSPMFPKKLNMEILDGLCAQGLISEDEKAAILVAASVINADAVQTERNLDMVSLYGDDYSEIKLGEVLRNVRERLQRRMAERFTGYMQEKMAEGLVPVDEVECEDVKIPVLEMKGDEFMFLVHRLGAFVDKDVDDPAQWDKWIEPSRDSEGRPVGYISTSAISDGMLNLAGGAYDDETVLYGFTDLTGGDVFRFAAEYDVYTGVSEDSESGGKKLTVGLQDFFFEHPREVIDRTRKRLRRIPDAYNEIALNRYPGGNDSPEARMRPNAIIVFGKDESAITERVKRHAVYFGKTKPRAEGDSSPVTGIPIILIDPEKYGRK